MSGWHYLVVGLVGTLPGCATTMRYHTEKVRPIPGAAQLRLVITEPLDARDDGRPMCGSTRLSDELQQVREAAREHVAKAGFAGNSSAIALAPTTPDQVEGLLQQASQRGATEVVFLRVLMTGSAGSMKWWALSPIVRSFPIFHQGAYGAVEALVVDPKTHELLARPLRLASQTARVTGWHYSPTDSRNEMLRLAVEAVLEDVVAACQAGYPSRSAVRDLSPMILSAPWVRQEGTRVVAPGFSFELPAGWNLARGRGEGVGGLAVEAPDGMRVSLSWKDTFLSAESYIEATRRDFPSQSPIVSDDESTLGGRPAQAFETVDVGGLRVLTRVTSIGGLGLVLRCSGPKESMARESLLCDDLFDSVQIDPLAVTEP